MTLGGLILRNALRNKRRLVLTLSGIAVSLFLLTILQVVWRGLTDPPASDQSALRIVVRHKVSLANMLFARYQPRIEQLPGVAACTKLLWFGGIYRDEKYFFPHFGCDAASLFKVLTEARIDPEQLQAFIRERTACAVGIKTMQRFGWKLGDKITLIGATWPCDLELTIRGVYSGSLDDANLFFHHEYFDELLGDKGFTGLFWLRATDSAAALRLIEQIDALFANSDAETLTETEHAFQIGFVSLLGNVKLLIASISTAVIFMLLLVTGGTMSIALRERVKEIALLKALGFKAVEVFGLVVAESFGLAVAGGLVGCLAAFVLVRLASSYKLAAGLFVNFDVTAPIFAGSLLIAGLLGILSCLLPAWSAVRRSVITGLRTID